MLRYKLISSDGRTILCSNKLNNILYASEIGSSIIDTIINKIIATVDERGKLTWVEK